MQRSSVNAAALSLAVLGFVLTQIVFYPGIMTYDARYVYSFIKTGPGDWQSPVMTWLWAMIDPVAPGSGSMFLLISATYWLAFALIALALVPRSPPLALALPLFALAPPALCLVGVIWRDVLLATAWLLAAALSFHAAGRRGAARHALQGLALALIAFGVLLRPNALIAAPLLAIHALFPDGFKFWRSALLYVPVAGVLYALIPLTYYKWLDAKREHPEQSFMVFDLGGITHFSKVNVFPGAWIAEEDTLLKNGCYQPTLWDIYWTHDPCKFVMARLERERIFGTPALMQAWLDAVRGHPLAYLRHRAAFMQTLLAGRNLTMWTADLNDHTKSVFADRPAFSAFRGLHDALQITPLYRGWLWLAACLALSAAALRARHSAEGAFVIGTCGSGLLYILTLFPVGVAPDFRFVYWGVLASIAGAAVFFAQRRVV
jgi:hypothetical protein